MYFQIGGFVEYMFYLIQSYSSLEVLFIQNMIFHSKHMALYRKYTSLCLKHDKYIYIIS